MDRAVLVYTTFPGLVEVEEVAKVIIERSAANCADIVPGVTPHEHLHSYPVPAISVIPIESVDRDYLNWLIDETKPAPT